MKKSFKNDIFTCAMPADASFYAYDIILKTDAPGVSVSVISSLDLRLKGLLIGGGRQRPGVAR